MQIDGGKWKQWQILFSWAPKSLQMVTAAMKLRHLLLGRKLWQTQTSILKSRDITLLTKVHIIKAMVFPVVMYKCESWTEKRAECQRIDTFKLWRWRILLRVFWIARTSSQSVLRKINPEIFIGRADDEAEAPKLWLSDAKSQFIGKDSDAGKVWGHEEKGVTGNEMAG